MDRSIPALHRLDGQVGDRCEMGEQRKGREMKYYRLTRRGKKQLVWWKSPEMGKR
jgi:DNA-binding PadR family transcriptional regulator